MMTRLLIRDVKPEQMQLATDAVTRLASSLTNYGLTRVGEPNPDGDTLSVEVEADAGDPCEIAKTGIRSVLEGLMRKRGIIYKSDAGRTDAVNSARAITLDQLDCQSD